MGIPSVNQGHYTKLETEIGQWWCKVLEDEIIRAGEEEKALAIAANDFHDGVPAITVVCDGGWSKRSHKHTYNAMGGVGVIFGHKTKKLLHIGIRNRLCYICSQAETKNIEPAKHNCYKNWNDSAQSMESDILVEGFLCAESKHGVRYMRLIGDGDSSTLQDIVEKIPVWGKHVKKLECANHACKCLRNHLEQLVNDKPSYKGKGKLTKVCRVRIVTAVRCAIKMRSLEKDKNQAITKLKKDIRNAGRHVLGLHDFCSTDFCKYKEKGVTSEETKDSEDINDNEDNEDDVFISTEAYWRDSVKDISEVEEKSIRKGGKSTGVDKDLLKDVFFYLNRMSDKADRLIGNFTSNLAESWMHIRCKFDGGKVYNKCFRASFYARCYGGALRSAKGPAWSPMLYQQATGKRPDSVYLETYRIRSKQHVQSLKTQKKDKHKDRKRKRKLNINKQSGNKKAKLKYGKGVLDDSDDISENELNLRMNDYLDTNVKVSKEEIKEIEENTREQSLNQNWHEERKKRITSSMFGEIMSRGVNNNSSRLTERLLYTKFTGNKYTRKGLNEESITLTEYENKLKEREMTCSVRRPGFQISQQHHFLGASADGVATFEDGSEGLVEVKNLLQNEKLLIKDAAIKKKNFCLTMENDKPTLKKNHKFYYQVQGQLNIYEKEWCDFVVRRTNPYDIFICRIQKDSNLWKNKMVPKLKCFYYTHVLPELAVPRHGTVSGIRKPNIPWFEEQKWKSGDNHCDNPTRDTCNPTRDTCNPTTDTCNPTRDTCNPTTDTCNPTRDTCNPTRGTCKQPRSNSSSSRLIKTVYSQEQQIAKRNPKQDGQKKLVDVPHSSNNQPTHTVQDTPSSPVSLERKIENSDTEHAVKHMDSSSQTRKRSKRQAKVKFLGRRISHLWDDQPYIGTVVSVVSGRDGDAAAVYGVQYEDDDEVYDVDKLLEEYMAGELKFLDI